jgi:hypothetical protein
MMMETVTGLSGKPVDVVVDPAERQARGLPEKIDSSEYHFGTAGPYLSEADKVRRVYREMSPRAVATMGQWLADTLGGAGARLARMECEDQERQDRERSELHESLANLK